jgi:hypothetical protein
MPSYTLHVPHIAAPGEADALLDAVVVRDGFSWGALIFQPVWFLWHRLWYGAVANIAAILAVAVACRVLNVGGGVTFLTLVALALLVANEANAIRAWDLERRGLVAWDAVIADDLDAAEAKAFARWLDHGAGAAARPGGRGSAASGPAAPAPKGTAIVGLFPEPEPGR